MFRFVRVLMFVMLFAGVVSAQNAPYASGGRGQFPGCPKCGVISYVDIPTAEQTVSVENFTIQGWGFECVSGTPITRVDIWYQDYAGYWLPLKQPTTNLDFGQIARPDVMYAFSQECPRVQELTGWSLKVDKMPVGLRRIQIKVWWGPYYETHSRTYLVIDDGK
jgi:hypothetical protein